MMYVVVLLFFYLLVFIHDMFVSSIIIPGALIILLYLVRRNYKLSLALLFMILLFSLFSSSLEKTRVYIPFDQSDVSALYGTVVTQPNRKKNRYIGYSLMLESAVNSKGDYFSSTGKVYVIGPDLGVTLGDKVYVKGAMKEDYFLFIEGAVKDRNTFGRIRRKINYFFLKSLPPGDVGNMISLLLSGTTLDGDGTLQDNVRALGLSHLLSLSGMHLGYITALTLPFLSAFLSTKRAKRAKNVILFAFVFASGLRPSLMRSLIFVILIPLFGIEYSFILSLVALIKLFPFYVDEVATILSFTSLSGILMVSSYIDALKKSNIPVVSSLSSSVMASVAATVTSAPIVYAVFCAWQPYSFLFSVAGMPLITILFIMVIVRFIIPKLDVIIQLIIEIIKGSEVIGEYIPLSRNFALYYPLAAVFVLFIVISAVLERRRH